MQWPRTKKKTNVLHFFFLLFFDPFLGSSVQNEPCLMFWRFFVDTTKKKKKITENSVFLLIKCLTVFCFVFTFIFLFEIHVLYQQQRICLFSVSLTVFTVRKHTLNFFFVFFFWVAFTHRGLHFPSNF